MFNFFKKSPPPPPSLMIRIRFRKNPVDVINYAVLDCTSSPYDFKGAYYLEGHLVVLLGMTFYEYKAVPEKLWAGLNRSSHPGLYWEDKIKGRPAFDARNA